MEDEKLTAFEEGLVEHVVEHVEPRNRLPQYIVGRLLFLAVIAIFTFYVNWANPKQIFAIMAIYVVYNCRDVLRMHQTTAMYRRIVAKLALQNARHDLDKEKSQSSKK